MRAGWILPSDEVLQRDTADLTSYRIEAREDDGLRGVIDDEVDAGELLEGPDVAALTADDAALDVVVGDGYHGYGFLRHIVPGVPLDGKGQDFLRLSLSRFPGFGFNPSDNSRRLVLGFLFHGIYEKRLGL